MSSLRGGFKSVAHGVTGQRKARPASRRRRILSNVVTVLLLLIAAVLLVRRFGFLRH